MRSMIALAGAMGLAGSTASLGQQIGQCPIPPRDCSGSASYCTTLLPFTPVVGTGYDNYPINGERPDNQYRSYARRDLMMLVKHASAVVACKAAGWPGGNGHPLGLGDMSEVDGNIPGTSIGRPGHPRGTHLKGRDMDIAYYQTTGTDNRLRAVCPYRNSNGVDVDHCTGAPTILDVRRTALFIGTLLTSDRTRVIGVDGRIEPLLHPALRALCNDGTLERIACDRMGKLSSETSNTGLGWFRHHHHHLHISFKKISGAGFRAREQNERSIAPGRRLTPAELRQLQLSGAPGHILRE